MIHNMNATTKDNQILTDQLDKYGLKILPIITARLAEEDAELLKTYIFNETGVNIYHKAHMSTLSEEEITKLKEFETTRADILMTLHTTCMVSDLKDDLNFVKSRVQDNTPKHVYRIAYFLVGTIMMYVFCLTFVDIPVANQKYADFLSGATVTGALSVVLGYIFNRNSNTRNGATRSTDRAGDHRPPPRPCERSDDADRSSHQIRN